MEPTTSRMRQAFDQDGFVAIEHYFTSAELHEAARLLDPLFERFTSLPSRHAFDLGASSDSRPRLPDLNNARRLEPALSRTKVFEKARALARQLLGAPVFCTFDHAIYKPASQGPPTPWHQDQAYAGFPRPLRAVHLWIPLQPATAANGCMWFVPGSHRRGLVPHDPVPGTKGTLLARDVDHDAARCCPLPLGGVTVHGPLTLHMTGANTTGQQRKAWIIHFARFGKLGRVHPANLLADAVRAARRRDARAHA